MFQFQYIHLVWLFLAIVLLAIAFFNLLRWKKKVRRKMGDPDLIRQLTINFSPARFASKFFVVSIAMAVGIVAAMNPRQPGKSENTTREGIDIAIALDVSKSMLATDLQPNRLERARQFIGKLMAAMPNDRIALILFAGKAYLQMPLTIDPGAARMFLSSAGPESVPQQGTVISDALRMSARVFDNADQRFKSVLLITDGEDHDENAIATAKELAQQGVMINAVGVGSASGSVIPDPVTGETKKDETGVEVISKLNESTLVEIAKETNGVYIGLNGSDDAVRLIKAQLSQIETKAFSDISQVNFKTWYGWFAGAMLFLLLIEYFIPERRKVKA